MADKFQGKFTLEELLSRKVGHFVNSDLEWKDWQKKRAVYEVEGLKLRFFKMVAAFKVLFVDYRGQSSKDFVENAAQKRIDTYLLLRASSEEFVPLPGTVGEIAIAKDEKTEKPEKDVIDKLDPKDFEGKKSISENQLIRWVFENMEIAGLKPVDAPSAGAWTLLTQLRGNKQQRNDFYKTTWTKLLTKESGEQGDKLQDTGKPVRELIDKLLKGLPESG